MHASDLLRLGSRYFAQEIAEQIYLRSGVDRTRPTRIVGVVNHRCNYKCSYCRFWRLDRYAEEMSIAQWQAALLDLRRFIGRYLIQFSGGEPFIKCGFVDLLEFCHAREIDWGVITNGSRLRGDVIRRVVAAQPMNVDISIDGSSAATHDVVRGVPGSFARISAGVAALRRERDAHRVRFAIRIKPTIHRRNFRQMLDLVRWAVEVGATTVDFSPVREDTSEVTADLWPTLAETHEIDRVVDDVIAMRRDGAPIETSEAKLRSFAGHFRRELVFHGKSPCRVGLREFHILPDGEVEACWFWPSLGNVRKLGAAGVWQSPGARAQRGRMVACERFGSGGCANSCLNHRTLRQNVARSLRILPRLRQVTATEPPVIAAAPRSSGMLDGDADRPRAVRGVAHG